MRSDTSNSTDEPRGFVERVGKPHSIAPTCIRYAEELGGEWVMDDTKTDRIIGIFPLNDYAKDLVAMLRQYHVKHTAIFEDNQLTLTIEGQLHGITEVAEQVRMRCRVPEGTRIRELLGGQTATPWLRR